MTPPASTPRTPGPYRYRVRDLSWLDFNARVLQEAQDRRVPLYERIKFLAIYSSNLDEFFRVRVASLVSLLHLPKKHRGKHVHDADKLLAKIQHTVRAQQEAFGKTYREDILPELARQGVVIRNDQELTPRQETWVRKLFYDRVRPHIFPLLLQQAHAPYFLQNRVLYLISEMVHPDERETTLLGMVEVPSQALPRFYVLPSQPEEPFQIILLDDVLRLNMPLIYPDYIPQRHFSIKLTRSGELDWGDEEQGDLVEKIRRSLKRRNLNPPTRLLYDRELPPDHLPFLAACFDVPQDELVPGGRHHNFSDFFALPNPGKRRLSYRALQPLPHPQLSGPEPLHKAIARQDHLLHTPYQQFQPFLRWLQEAAQDPAVTTIYITLYRVAADSQVVHTLLDAQRNGKRVVCFFEVKARFDEESNLFWASEVARAGAEVHYSLPGIKVHTKTALVEREEDGETRRYAFLGTGNFNEKTAQLYTDTGLFTADPRLTHEVRQIFAYLIEQKTHRYEHLLVAPTYLRDGLEQLILDEMALAREGKPAHIILKMNSLEDAGMIALLYKAAEVGVHIDLIVRGICCLDASQARLQGRIRAISIIDRYLEHTRVFYFANSGQPRLYLSSADMMTRNLDKRVECAFPIYDARLQRQVLDILQLQLRDNCKARVLDGTGRNLYVPRHPGEPARSSQVQTYVYLAELKD